MNQETIRTLLGEHNPAKVGIVVSSIVIIAGLFPDINTSWFVLKVPYSFQIILLGFASLFYFVSIKVNMKEYRQGEDIITSIPMFKSPLSKECFNISIILLFLFFLSLLLNFGIKVLT